MEVCRKIQTMVILLATILLTFSLSVVKCESSINCNLIQRCRDCLQFPDCAWCTKPDLTNEAKRCINQITENGLLLQCKEFIVNPDNEFQPVEAKTVGSPRDGSSKSSENLIQLSPQIVNIKLRPHKEYSFNVTYRPAEDYPLDIYYLTDVSSSMRSEIKHVYQHAEKIAQKMKNITKNFRLGFGYFLDKQLAPFENENCNPTQTKCGIGFKHVMKLDTNSSIFERTVINTTVLPGYDLPEGGFDGLMQVMVCKEQIGWRDKARKLIFMATDYNSHFAGDGKLAGIFLPNDGKCHLDRDGYYTESMTQDYPSVSHINYVSVSNGINIIFLVPENMERLYKNLSSQMTLASTVVRGHTDIDVLIRQEYDKITSEVKLENNASSLTAHIKSKCLSKTAPLNSETCTELKVGDEVKFNLTIKLLKCPDNPKDWNQALKIYTSGINESIIVNLQAICSCSCEKTPELNASRCNFGGNYNCGICDCDENHFGQNCLCKTKGSNLNFDINKNNCRPNNKTKVDCSGRGKCVCGECDCDKDKDVTGRFCECDSQCPRTSYGICNSHGTCECGKCVCENGWESTSVERPACDCAVDDKLCIPMSSDNEEVCFGRGPCVCGKCECIEGYNGAFCENYSEMLEEHCEAMRYCVECMAFGTGEMRSESGKNGTKCNKRCSFEVKVSPDIAKAKQEENREIIECLKEDENGCPFSFFYYYSQDQTKGTKNMVVVSQSGPPVCPKPDIMRYVLYLVLTLVLGGFILLIIWKLATMAIDRVEYNKFLKEQKNAKWGAGGNPLYKAPTSSFQNPVFSEHNADDTT